MKATSACFHNGHQLKLFKMELGNPEHNSVFTAIQLHMTSLVYLVWFCVFLVSCEET